MVRSAGGLIIGGFSASGGREASLSTREGRDAPEAEGAVRSVVEEDAGSGEVMFCINSGSGGF